MAQGESPPTEEKKKRVRSQTHWKVSAYTTSSEAMSLAHPVLRVCLSCVQALPLPLHVMLKAQTPRGMILDCLFR